MTVEYPSGLIPAPVVVDPFTSNRLTTYTFELLDRDEGLKGVLEGVAGGSVTWRRDALIKGGGMLSLSDLGQDIDWLNDRIRISITVNGVTWGLGVWLPTAPKAQWAGGQRTWQVDLHDKLTVLEEDKVLQTTYVSIGDDVLEVVEALIQSANETNVSATDISATVAAPRVWPPGTSKLRIINNLLDSAGYFPLQANGEGAFLIEPYVQPASRPYRYEFLDGPAAIYTSLFNRGLDNFSVPNRIIATTTGTEDDEGYIASAENMDVNSPYSYPNRGRWVALFYENVESVNVAALATWCQRRLADWNNPTASEAFEFMSVPLDIYDAVRFRNAPANLDVRATVEVVTIPLDGNALATAEVREVMSVSTTTGSAVWDV